MKRVTNKLGGQLLLILVLSLCIIAVVIGIVIPSIIKTRYEGAIFNQLESQLKDLDSNISNHTNISDVAYVYMEDGTFYISPSTYEMFSDDELDEIIESLENENGKMVYNGTLYYYYKIETDNTLKISIMDGSFVNNAESMIIKLAIYVLLFAYLGVVLIVTIWSRRIVTRIEWLKEKVDNLNNPDYQSKPTKKYDDELRSLDLAIDDVRTSLMKQEELKTQFYQNISHDFKTPLTVIKSYIEAVEDGVEDEEKALEVILEQTDKLEAKVHSLLYLNKLDYLKDEEFDFTQKVDMNLIIDKSTEKFKHQNDDVKIIKTIDKSAFYGTEDIWETIIDNILNNFYRYATSCIKITVKNNKLTLYNDGPNIKEDFLDAMFIPYRKGIKGEFGLGLSIVKKSLVMMGYDITVENHNKKGVSFIITKKGS